MYKIFIKNDDICDKNIYGDNECIYKYTYVYINIPL